MTRDVVIGATTLLGITGLVLLLTYGLLLPPGRDMAALAGFLLISGGVAVVIGLVGGRFQLPARIGSFRAKLLLVCGLTAILALANVGFTAVLMFLSHHDLALLAGLVGFSLGISTFVAFSFSRSISRSLSEVLEAVGPMKAGNLDTRVPVRGRDEVGELAAALNGMAERVEASFNRERELEGARRELVRAVSHNLRTPLGSIRAMIESINDGVVTDPDTIKRYLRATQSEVENLSQLINDLFELSQMDAGVLELHMETASLQDLISDTLESMSAQAVGRRLTLDGAVDDELSPVVMDAQRVQRVLYNLLQNAIRHTPRDGSVFLQARDAGPKVRVDVVDTGEGIAEKDLARLFQRTYRSDTDRSRVSGSSGVGLSIARGIVEAHGGRIWAESTLGKRSTFSFTLPKSGARVAAVREPGQAR